MTHAMGNISKVTFTHFSVPIIMIFGSGNPIDTKKPFCKVPFS